MSFKDTLIGLFIVLIWGVNFVVIAWGLDDLPPLLLGAARFLFVAMLGSLFVRAPDTPWRWLALYALTISVGQFAFLFLSMDAEMPAGLASLVLQSQALFTAIFAVLWLQEKINLAQMLALAISSVGLTVIGDSHGNSNMTAIGFGLSLAAATCWAAGNIVNRAIARRGHQTDIALVIWSAWFAVPPFLMASFVFEGGERMLASLVLFDWQTLAAVLYLSLLASIVGFGLWSRLLAKYPAALVTPLSLGVPVFGFASAALFLNEEINAQQGIGISLVLLGLLVNTFGSRFLLLVNRFFKRLQLE